MTDEKLSPPPEQGRADIVAGITKGIVGAVPLVGPLAAEAIEFFWSPLRKRQEDWLVRMWLGIRKLQTRNALPADETLAANQAFMSAAVHAFRIAARTHRDEKLEALRNAVLNVAAGSAPEDDIQAMFLDAVDSLTVSHIDVLRRRASQGKRLGRKSGYLLAERIQPPRVGRDMFAQIIRELTNRGFVEVNTALDQLDAGTVRGTHVRLTEYGSQFLSFITSPLVEGMGG